MKTNLTQNKIKQFLDSIRKKTTTAFYMIINKEIPINEQNRGSHFITLALSYFVLTEVMAESTPVEKREQLIKLQAFFEITKLDVNNIEVNGYTLLQIAILARHGRLMNYLVGQLNANVNRCNSAGKSPLQIAVENGKTILALYLIKNGAIIRSNTAILNYVKFTPLHELAKVKPFNNSDLSFAKLLINLGVDLKAIDANGFTALHWAAISGNYKMVTLLIEMEQTFNMQNTESDHRLTLINTLSEHEAIEKRISALAFAISSKERAEKKQIIFFLIKHNANLAQITNHRNFFHFLPTLNDFSDEELTSFANKLLVSDVDINLQDDQGMTPLHYAAIGARVDLIRLLISCGAKITIRNNKNETPIDLLFINSKSNALEAEQRRHIDNAINQLIQIHSADLSPEELQQFLNDFNEETFCIYFMESFLEGRQLAKTHMLYLFYNKFIQYPSIINMYNTFLKNNPELPFAIELEKFRNHLTSSFPNNCSKEKMEKMLLDLYIEKGNIAVIEIPNVNRKEKLFLELFDMAIKLANIELAKYLLTCYLPRFKLKPEELQKRNNSIEQSDCLFQTELNQMLETLTIKTNTSEYQEALSLSNSLTQLFFATKREKVSRNKTCTDLKKQPPIRSIEEIKASLKSELTTILVKSKEKTTAIKRFLDKPHIREQLSQLNEEEIEPIKNSCSSY